MMQCPPKPPSFISRLAEAFDSDHPGRLPRHKIFISHSGKQKDCAEQLCKDLEAYNYYPFFDKRSHSLPKGEPFPTRIFKAARECFLAIVLLSEEFLRADSKWPMMELAAFVQAQKDSQHVKILPVLLGNLQPEHLKDTAGWIEQWTKWGERDSRIDPGEWQTAVQALRPVNMIVQKNDGEVALRSKIVKAVLRLIPPDVRSDVSRVQGKDHLYKDIMDRFSEMGISQSGSKIVGVYGVAGVGKSTVCMILTHFLNEKFQGRVCHVEFGKRECSALIDLQRQALKQLTEADQDYLHMHINHEAEGWNCLKERMCRQRVFLALDNVSRKGESWEAARKFLYELCYAKNSMVVVTSRSKDVLEELLTRIPESCCVCCPYLNKEEAEKIVLDNVGIQNVEVLTEQQRHILQKAVETCDFGFFHPMALKLLAIQLGMIPSSWKLSSFMFNSEASDTEHMLFEQLETVFLSELEQKTRDMFMDIALFTPEIVNNGLELHRWLRDTRLQPYGSTLDGIRKELNVLKSKSLLEVWSHDSDNVYVHDLHRDLAKQRTQVGNESGRFVYHETCIECDTSLLSTLTERACFVATRNTKMAFDRCSMTLKLLSAKSCTNLVELNLQGLAMLVSLELSACYELGTLDLKGLTKLRWLCLTSCESLKTLDTSRCEALMSVCVSKCNRLKVLELKYSKKLESLCVSYNQTLEVVDLGSGECLRRLGVWFCEVLREVKTSCESVCLDEFKKRGCPLLRNMHGCINKLSDIVSCVIVTRWYRISEDLTIALQASKCLQVLDLWECTMSRLPDLRNCCSLRELKLSEVDVLLDSDNRALLHEYVDILCASSDKLALPVSLKELRIGNCRNTVVKEICWKVQGLKNILVLSMQTVRVSWDWELYRSGSKVFSQSLCLDNAVMCNLESLRDQLHQKIGMLEPEETNDVEQSYSDESEQSCCDDIECADQMGTSCSVEFAGEGSRSFQQTAHISVETPSKASGLEQISHDTAAFARNKCEENSNSTFIKMLSNVMYWIWEFLGDTGMQSHVKGIITNSWQKQPGQLALGEYEDLGQSWERLFLSDEMRNVHYSSPNYVLLETFNNFDTLRELFNKEGLSNKAYKLISDKLKKQTVKQLTQQMHVLQALVPGQNCLFEFEPWELKVMDEIFMFNYMLESFLAEKAAEWKKLIGREKDHDEEVMWEKLPGDGILLTRRKFEELKGICNSLMQRRQWALIKDANKQQDEILGKWKQDWLRSCKVCLSIQVFCIVLNGRDSLQAACSLHRQWFSEMMQKVNCLLQRGAEKLLTTSTGGVVNDVKLEDLSRAWKAQQWLQKLALSLSTKWVEEDIRKILSSTPEVSLLEEKYFKTLLEAELARQTPALFTSEVLKEGKIDLEWLANVAKTDLKTRKILSLLGQYFRKALAVVKQNDHMAKENLERLAERLLEEMEKFIFSTDGDKKLRALLMQIKSELGRTFIDVGAMQNMLKRESLPFVEWEANDIMYWEYKYTIIENATREEGLLWGYSCREGGSLHPNNDWKEAALHDLWDEVQALEERKLMILEPVLEKARAQRRVHDILFRLQLINLSVFDQIHEDIIEDIIDVNIHGIDVNRDIIYVIREIIEYWPIWGIGEIRKIDFNRLLITFFEINLAMCLQEALQRCGIIKDDIIEDAIIGSRMRERRLVVASQHDISGLQKWAKAAECPLRPTWEAVNSARLPLVLPKLRHCHISSTPLLVRITQEAL